MAMKVLSAMSDLPGLPQAATSDVKREPAPGSLRRAVFNLAGGLNEAVSESCDKLKSSIFAGYTYELAKAFSALDLMGLPD
jgi:hypothetical protein